MTCTHDNNRGCGCNGGWGNYIRISHGNGLETIYAHCSVIYVSKHQTVSRGERIAAVGSTGNSTGNHLHFEVRTLANSYKAVNPLPYLP